MSDFYVSGIIAELINCYVFNPPVLLGQEQDRILWPSRQDLFYKIYSIQGRRKLHVATQCQLLEVALATCSTRRGTALYCKITAHPRLQSARTINHITDYTTPRLHFQDVGNCATHQANSRREEPLEKTNAGIRHAPSSYTCDYLVCSANGHYTSFYTLRLNIGVMEAPLGQIQHICGHQLHLKGGCGTGFPDKPNHDRLQTP